MKNGSDAGDENENRKKIYSVKLRVSGAGRCPAIYFGLWVLESFTNKKDLSRSLLQDLLNVW